MTNTHILGLKALGVYLIAADEKGKLYGIEIKTISQAEIGVEFPSVEIWSQRGLYPQAMPTGEVNIQLQVIGHEGTITIKDAIPSVEAEAIKNDVLSIAGQHLKLIKGGDEKVKD